MIWPPASLTARLGFLFALVAALTFALAGAYLYRSLARQLDQRDDAELLGKIELVRHLLSEAESTARIREDPHLFQDAIVGHQGLLLAVKSSSGEILVRNIEPEISFSNLTPVPIDRKPDYSDITSWTTRHVLTGRVVAAWGRVGNSSNQDVQIVVARQSSDRSLLLGAYRRDLLVAVIGGAVLAALLGHAVVRRGMRPVREIAAKAHEITASHLDARLGLMQAPTELQELVDAFNRMLDRVQDGVDRLSQFSSDIAHDLRTPIANLLGETQVTLSRPRSVEQYQALLVSNVEELERLTRMIENMLFLARADNAQLAIHVEAVDASAELQRIADYFDGIATEAGVRLAVEGSAMVTADPTLLRRAVSNLVANAIRHTPPGGEVKVSAIESTAKIEISVRNPGSSISPQMQAHIFDRFYRGDDARVDSSSSSGLGLAIVKSIMELHRGSVHVSSGVGDTDFRLVFPA